MQVILIIIYYYKYKSKLKKNVLSVTDKYLEFLKSKTNNKLIGNSLKSNKILKNEPPKINSNYEDTSKNINKILKDKSDKNLNLNSSRQNSNDKIKNIKIFEDKNKEFEPIMFNIKNDVNIDLNEYIQTDLNEMDYDDAIREDKRKFCQYFFEKLKTEQIILRTFFTCEILQPIPVKIILLILNIDLYLIINALFFNENYISDLLNSESDTIFSFINRILDRIVIITITGVIINYIIEFFFVPKSKLKRVFKMEKENILILKYEIVQLIKNIYTRFNIFIILTIIIMVISLYYIFCFNNVYPAIKIEWIKSSIIIISIMQIIPIFFCLFDTCIRFISFRCKSERLFRLSTIF